MTDTTHLTLPFIEGSQAQKHVTHNEALRILDTLVMLAVDDRDFGEPPASPAEGARYLVKSPASGLFSGKAGQVASFVDGEWRFFQPQPGWTCYVRDEGTLLAYSGTAWAPAFDVLGGVSDINNVAHLGLGTTADDGNPLAAKLNNALFTARGSSEGGDGNLRYKMNKQAAANTLSLLMQTAYSGRAEIGLSGDDDLHFKVSPDGNNWSDALVLDRTTGNAKLKAGFSLTGSVTPAQLTADQNDYNPAGFAAASVLRVSGNATRTLTGISGGADGRVIVVLNVGSNAIVLKDASALSAFSNRFAFGADVTLAAKQGAALIYDAADARWKLLSGQGASSSAMDVDLTLAGMAMLLSDTVGAPLFLGASGNRFADSFKTLAYVDVAAAINLDVTMQGLLKASAAMGAGRLPVSMTANNLPTPFVASASKEYTPAFKAFDGSAATYWQAYPGAATETLTADPAIPANAIGYAVTASTAPAYAPNAFSLQGSNDNANWTTLDTRSGQVNWASNEVRSFMLASVSAAYRYYRLLITAGNTAGDYRVATFQVFAPASGNVVVASVPLTAASVPTTMKVSARIKFIDGIVLGPDLIFEVSRDGGTTWTVATMNDRFTSASPVAGVRMLESNAIDVSGQPSGTSIRWRLRTFTNKQFELHDINLAWS